MTSLAVAEGWIMRGTGPKVGRTWTAWREVGAAWVLAAVLASALLLTLPGHDRAGSQESVWSLSPTVASHTHQKGTDSEGPATDASCSDRDYADERC